MGKIKFYVKRSYGNDRAYLADEAVATAWTHLSGKTTLSPADLKNLKIFGAEFEKIDEPTAEKKFKQES
jgi:hypothetical protein